MPLMTDSPIKLKASAPSKHALNYAQLFFHGNSENFLLVTGYLGSTPLTELTIPLSQQSKEDLISAGTVLKSIGADTICVTTRTVWEDDEGESGHGLWLMVDSPSHKQLELYGAHVSVGNIFQSLTGLMSCQEITQDSVPAILSCIHEGLALEESENVAEFMDKYHENIYSSAPLHSAKAN